MKSFSKMLGRGTRIVAVLAFGVAIAVPAFGPAESASAGVLSSRKIQLGSSADGNTSTDANGVAIAAGNGGNGAQTKHTFTFTPTANTIGSIVFMYCTTPFIGTTCTAPTGLDVSTAATVVNPSNFAASYSVDTTTNASTASGVGYFAPDTNACTGSGVARTNCILIKKASAGAEAATAKSVTFGTTGEWLKNPTVTGTFYVRIITFSTTDFNTTGSTVDEGAVAAAIAEDIDITAKVQEQLKFSVSATTNAPTTSCVALPAGGAITIGAPGTGVLDASTAYDNHSYFRVSTNSANGTVVQYSGDTLKTATGSLSITALTGPTASAPGTEQFGMGFDSADATADGWSVTHLTTRPSPYNTANGTITNAGTATFGFDTNSVSTPVTIASSSGIVTCDTLSVRYLANISPTTEPGIYRTSIGYIATPTY